jgi:NADH dehydrogenase/NADH:ubiquinone oxidoreductase subunit G
MAQLGFGLKIDETAQENGYDRYSKTLRQTLGAIAADNWEYNPLEATKTHRSINAAVTESIRGGDVRMDRQELNKEYNELGLYFKEDEFQSVVDIMVEKKRS